MTTGFRSINQGLLWIEGITTGLPSYTVPVMTDDLHGWALSTNPPDSNFYLTHDGGRTWTAVAPLAAPTP